MAFVVLALFLQLEKKVENKISLLVGLTKVDWMGSLAIIGATISLLLGIEFGGVTFSWSSVTVLCLIISGVALTGCFLLVEAKVVEYPIIPLRLFRKGLNVAAFVVAFLHGLVSSSSRKIWNLMAKFHRRISRLHIISRCMRKPSKAIPHCDQDSSSFRSKFRFLFLAQEAGC